VVSLFLSLSLSLSLCVRVCVRACMRACVHAHVCAESQVGSATVVPVLFSKLNTQRAVMAIGLHALVSHVTKIRPNCKSHGKS